MQRNAWLGLLVFAAAVVTMGRVVVHDFTDWDDRYTIAQNPRLNPPTWEGLGYYWKHSEYGLYIPGTYTVWAGLAKLGWVDVPDERGYRINPWVFHSASVVLHGLAGVVVFGLLRKTRREGSGFGVQGSGQSDVGAFVGACLFAVHPVQVETVAWASGMKDVLCGLFSLIALWQYAGWVQAWGFRVQRRLHYMMATLAFVCALLCKPSAMVVPAMAVVIDWLLLRRSLVRALAGTALWWPIVLVWMVVARASQETYGIIGRLPRCGLGRAGRDRVLSGKIAWPLGLAVDYGRTPAVTQDHRWLWWTWIFPVAMRGCWRGVPSAS
jgi:hypothetical protein